ncbi:MAG TPA: hypothetical protein PLP17_10760, partial [Oligoflexia bacterium]|nr:hypothetical protein [Oligoflexia bacterium]
MMRLALILAFRDSRRSTLQLGMMALLMIAGSAALTAITLFESALSRAVTEQSKILLGADLVVSARMPFKPEDIPLPPASVHAFSQEISFASMAFFPGQGRSRLVQAVALSPGFPFYGELITNPPDRLSRLGQGVALADQVLLLQSGARLGDKIQLGQAVFNLDAVVEAVPGIPGARELIAPRVYFDLSEAAKTGLLGFGSRASYKIYYRINAGVDVEQLAAGLKPKLIDLHLTLQTPSGRRERVERTLNKVYLFLDVMSVAAIVLAALGVGSAVRLHLQSKKKSVALLRCLGATPVLSSGVFLAQIMIWGAASSLIGAFLGAGLQKQLFGAVVLFLPVPVEAALEPASLLLSVLCVMLGALVVSIPPLLTLAQTAPNAALREQPEPVGRAMYAEVLCLILLLSLSALYVMLKTKNPAMGLACAGMIFCVGTALAMAGAFLRRLLCLFMPASLPYAIRQAGRNLYRPLNQTVLVLMGIGLTTYLIGLSQVLEKSV